MARLISGDTLAAVGSGRLGGTFLSQIKPLLSYLCIAIAMLHGRVCASQANQFNLTLSEFGIWYNYNAATGSPDSGDPGTLDGTGKFEVGNYPNNPFLSQSTQFATFFVLDLTGIPTDELITSVTLQQLTFFAPGYVESLAGPGTCTFWMTSDTPADVEQTGTSAAVWNSLTGGTSVGSGVFETTGTENGGFSLTMAGNSDFLAFLNENLGQDVVIGASDSFALYTTSYQTPTFTVTTTTVPEPSTTALLSIGPAASLLLFRKTQRTPNQQPRASPSPGQNRQFPNH